MSKSWNSRKDPDREERRAANTKPKVAKPKSELRREERALKTGDVEAFYDDFDDFDDSDHR